MVGALAGAAIYSGVAALLWRGWRWPAWVAVLLPASPILVILATTAGIALPVQPDAAMKGVLVLQGVAAVASVAWLRASRADSANDLPPRD